MLTAWSNEIEDEHRLLTGATRVLFRNPTLPSNILQGSLARDACSITTEVAQPESFKDVVDIWSVLDNDLRPSVRVTVTVPLEVDMEYLTPPVRDVDMRGPSPDYVPPSDKPVRLEGKVVRGGRPVPDARIRIDRSSGITDADGAYALRGVKPGTHTAMVVDADSVFCTVDVVVPGDGLIELPVASEQEPPVRAASGTKATARKIEDGRNRLKEK
jgi:hypothetical protein